MKGIRILKFLLFAIIAVALSSVVVLYLWNWLMPAVFGLRSITFLQALGLLILSRILFGGFRGHGSRPGRRWQRGMMEQWAKMTPEEREKFRQGLRHRCSPSDPTATV